LNLLRQNQMHKNENDRLIKGHCLFNPTELHKN